MVRFLTSKHGPGVAQTITIVLAVVSLLLGPVVLGPESIPSLAAGSLSRLHVGSSSADSGEASAAEEAAASTSHPGGWCGRHALPAERLLQGAPPPPDIDTQLPLYWRRLENICSEAERQYMPCAARDPAQRSTANVTVAPFSFGGLGVWNSFTFDTFTPGGQRKARGGDAWAAQLRDYGSSELRIPARVLDQGDGTYLVAFVPLRPGNYSLTLRMLYTLCSGYQEPFPSYVETLEDKGKEAHCYMGLKAANLTVIEVPELYHPLGCRTLPQGSGSAANTSAGNNTPSGSNTNSSSNNSSTEVQHLPGWLLRSDRHLWRNGSRVQLERCCMPPPRHLAAGPETTRAIMWGDSTQRYPWSIMLRLAREPCLMQWRPRLFFEDWDSADPAIGCHNTSSGNADPELEAALLGCTAGAPFTSVPIGCNSPSVQQYFPGSLLVNMTHWQYNDTYARLALNGSGPPKEFSYIYYVGYGCLSVEDISRTLEEVNRTGDAVIMNIGPHCTKHFGLAQWQHYMDKVALLVSRLRSKVVWRSSFALREDGARTRWPDASSYSVHLLFDTDARRQLFDSYAEYAMRQAGIAVWDIGAYGLGGLHRPKDIIHFDGFTSRTLNLEAAELLLC